MALHDYVADEIALDHAEGLLSRREALHKLLLMGFTATSAGTLLASALTSASAATKTTKKTVTPKKAATTKPVATSAAAITFAGPSGPLLATYASPAKPIGAVLVIHENRGLTDHFRAFPTRFAKDGYAALAIDLASRKGGTAAVAADMPAPLTSIPTADLVSDLKAALGELSKRAPGQKLGVIGFCFGGGMCWNLLQSGEPRLAAAAPFYGPTPDNPDFSGSKQAAVLGVYAELDARVNAGRDSAAAALAAAGNPHEIRTFPGVDHAFFNDTGARYNAAQATAAYAAVLAWFGKYLKS